MGRVALAEIPTWFRAHMTRLSGLRFSPADLTTHWEAMHDFPEPLLDAAVTRAARECINFPAPWTLLSFGEQARARVLPVPQEAQRGVELAEPVVLGTLPTGLVIKATREWRYYCDNCTDSGWRSVWCGDVAEAKPWQERGVCGRGKEHGSHEFVVACPCAASNPDVQRRLERQRQSGRRGGDPE